MILNDARNYSVDGDEINQLLLGTTLIWPPKEINDTGFLDYYYANIGKKFKISYKVDPYAIRTGCLNYRDNNNTIIENFLGPDNGKNPHIHGLDQNLNYSNDNIATLFNQFAPTGEVDQSMDYNNTNIQDVFGLFTPVVEADWDEYVVLNQTNMASKFLGPDDGDIPYVKPFDQYMGYKSNNISELFNNIPESGEYDQMLEYNAANMADAFCVCTPVMDADWDEYVVLNQTNIAYKFLGPDDGKNPHIHGLDQCMSYKLNNIEEEFNQFAPVGEVDQSMNYDNLNIETEFVALVNTSDPAAIIDYILDYDPSNISSLFLSPDAGQNINIDGKDQSLYYKSNNIAIEFPEPLKTADFDQDLVYSFSNIEEKFLP